MLPRPHGSKIGGSVKTFGTGLVEIEMWRTPVLGR